MLTFLTPIIDDLTAYCYILLWGIALHPSIAVEEPHQHEAKASDRQDAAQAASARRTRDGRGLCNGETTSPPHHSIRGCSCQQCHYLKDICCCAKLPSKMRTKIAKGRLQESHDTTTTSHGLRARQLGVAHQRPHYFLPRARDPLPASSPFYSHLHRTCFLVG